MRRPKVLIFIITDFARLDGGVLWAANLLECMARVPDMDFIVVSSGPDNVRTANQEFTKGLGLNHAFVPFRPVPISETRARFNRLSTTFDRVLTLLSDKYYFIFERDARRQRHVNSEVMDIIRKNRPDLIIVNGRNATLHVPSVFSLATPCCFITLDNEVDFHRLYRAQAGPLGTEMRERLERWICRHGNWIPNQRFRRYINSIYTRCAGIVALTRNDLPTDLPDHVVRAVIPPILRKSDLQWSCSDSRSVLFVGNMHVLKVMHVPNRLSIEWICTKFAPELSRIDSKVQINIIGASTDQVPFSWRWPNINFLGRADKERVRRQMTTDSLFIAPVANGHGAKLKLAECISHGMPFLATDAAMSGLPFLTAMPTIDLEQPGAAARLVVEYINNPEALTNLSQSIAAQAEQARTAQDAAWVTFLRCSMGQMRKDEGSVRSKYSVAIDDCEATAPSRRA